MKLKANKRVKLKLSPEEFGVLHVKWVLIDERTLLFGSVNPSRLDLNNNIEEIWDVRGLTICKYS